MGYMHIDNLYKNQKILMFKRCYALEKIHGTSAHIRYDKKGDKVTYFSGGASHMLFMEIFDREKLKEKLSEFGYDTIIIYGEAYGGKMQGMSKTYGKELKFVAFDVKIDDYWLSVPNAEKFVISVDLEFVDYKEISTDMEEIDKERDRESIQAVRNTGEHDKMREGVVLKPLMEFTLNNNSRVMAKHKRDEFKETRTKRGVDPEKQIVLDKANDIAEEWVTPMRLQHVLDKHPDVTDMSGTPIIMKAMVEDVVREAENEIVDSKEARKAIQRLTAQLLKKHFQDELRRK